jgi:excisionase family DNA binding protein
MMEKKEAENLSDLISISEAARVREVSHAAIQNLIRRGKLSSVEIGGRRFLSRSEVESYEPEPVGRPPKPKEETAGKGSKKGGKK